MKNVTLSLLAAAAIGAISIGSVSAMPINNLAGLGEAHFQDVRLVCDRFGHAKTRGAPIVPIMRRVTMVSLATATMVSLATATMVSLATAITEDRVSELARSASGGNPQKIS